MRSRPPMTRTSFPGIRVGLDPDEPHPSPTTSNVPGAVTHPRSESFPRSMRALRSWAWASGPPARLPVWACGGGYHDSTLLGRLSAPGWSLYQRTWQCCLDWRCWASSHEAILLNVAVDHAYSHTHHAMAGRLDCWDCYHSRLHNALLSHGTSRANMVQQPLSLHW